MNIRNTLINIRQVLEMTLTRSLFKHVINWPEYLADYAGFSTSDKITVHFRDGTKIVMRANTSDRWSIHEIILRNDYALTRLPEDKSVIIDLGAGEGAFSIFAAKLNPTARIVALEPNRLNYELATENIRMNHLNTQVKILPVACMAKTGKALLYLSRDRRAHSLVWKTGSAQTIKTISLSALFTKFHINACHFLKMDIEGAEYELLYSLSKRILQKIKTISMEYHNLDNQQANGQALARFLKKQKFTVNFADSADHSVGRLFAIRK